MPRGFFKKTENPTVEYLRARKSRTVKSNKITKNKYSTSVKKLAVHAISNGTATVSTVARVVGCRTVTIRQWQHNGVSERTRGRKRIVKDNSPEKKALEDMAEKDPFGRVSEISER